METKALKTQVFTNNIVFNESAEIPVDADFSLPDYCPEIVRILKCKAQPSVISKSISGGVVSIDGSINITLIYCDSENRVCAFEHLFPFNKTFEAGSDSEGAQLECRVKCEYLNCRAVTSRKVDIHGAAGIYVKLIKRRCNDIIADFDDPEIELRRGCIAATTPMGTVEKYQTVEEEIEISQGQPPIRSLIRYEADACIRESKLSNEKNIVKGELCVSILYCSEEGSVQRVKTQIPFSQLLEMPGVTDKCSCDTTAEIASIDIKPRTSATGETKSFVLTAKVLITTKACCDMDVDVVLDAYSRKFEAEVKRSDIGFRRISRTLDEICPCKETLEFPSGTIAQITDMWCEILNSACNVKEGQLEISGKITANLIAYDADGTPSFYEKPIDFKYKFPLGESGNVHCEPHIEVRSCSYTITGSGSVEIRLEIGIRAALYNTNSVSLITELTVDEKQQIKPKTQAALTVYFAVMGENVWDIARKYRASTDEIKRINEVSDILQEDKIILIPIG